MPGFIYLHLPSGLLLKRTYRTVRWFARCTYNCLVCSSGNLVYCPDVPTGVTTTFTNTRLTVLRVPRPRCYTARTGYCNATAPTVLFIRALRLAHAMDSRYCTPSYLRGNTSARFYWFYNCRVILIHTDSSAGTFYHAILIHRSSVPPRFWFFLRCPALTNCTPARLTADAHAVLRFARFRRSGFPSLYAAGSNAVQLPAPYGLDTFVIRRYEPACPATYSRRLT